MNGTQAKISNRKRSRGKSSVFTYGACVPTLLLFFVLSIIGCHISEGFRPMIVEKQKTPLEKRYWDYAEARIPKGTFLVSVEKAVRRIDSIGIFYRDPNETSNNYICIATPRGEFEKQRLIQQFENRLEVLAVEKQERELEHDRWIRDK